MKPWRNEIKLHIENWSKHLGNLNWWPKYVYHFTDIRNAASILKAGTIYSREEAVRLGTMVVDNASPEIIDRTPLEHTRFVRLYFRPRTPTQFRNEGIRPIGQRELGAHCPVPVYFCFDALEILSGDSTQVSDGNMGSQRATHSSEKDFFFDIPFHYVFHNGAFSPDQRDEIIFRRNAEVLIPDLLHLDPALRFIACRSEAERQTLLHMLPYPVVNQWENKIRLGEQGFFERKWTYVEEVVLVDDAITFRFNPSSQTLGPFEITVEYREHGSDPPRRLHRVVDRLDVLRVKLPADATWGELILSLDDAIAYSDFVFIEDIPF
jgi:hypothetical protein